MAAADALLVPAATHVSAALGGGLGAILLAERRHLRELPRRTLFLRWRTWAVTAPIYGAAVVWSRWGLVLFVAALAAKGLHEYARMTRLPAAGARAIWLAGVAAALSAVASAWVWLALPAVVLLAASAVPVARQDVRDGLRVLAASVLGFVWIPWLLASLLVIREHIPGGPGILLALGTAVAASDVLAFVAGRALGGPKLAPALSPAKTWGGVLGNVVGAAGGLALMGFALPAIGWGGRAALVLAVTLGCVWGDLLESLVKRAHGVKDTGSWLPGFGGLLDRIDSMLVAFPLALGVLAVIAR